MGESRVGASVRCSRYAAVTDGQGSNPVSRSGVRLALRSGSGGEPRVNAVSSRVSTGASRPCALGGQMSMLSGPPGLYEWCADGTRGTNGPPSRRACGVSSDDELSWVPTDQDRCGAADGPNRVPGADGGQRQIGGNAVARPRPAASVPVPAAVAGSAARAVDSAAQRRT